MRSYISLHTDLQARLAARVRKYREKGLSVAAACRAAKVSPRWYYYHRDLVEGPRQMANAS